MTQCSKPCWRWKEEGKSKTLFIWFGAERQTTANHYANDKSISEPLRFPPWNVTRPSRPPPLESVFSNKSWGLIGIHKQSGGTRVRAQFLEALQKTTKGSLPLMEATHNLVLVCFVLPTSTHDSQSGWVNSRQFWRLSVKIWPVSNCRVWKSCSAEEILA